MVVVLLRGAVSVCFGLHASWEKTGGERRESGRGGLGVHRSGGAHAGRAGEAVTGSAYGLLSPGEATSFVWCRVALITGGAAITQLVVRGGRVTRFRSGHKSPRHTGEESTTRFYYRKRKTVHAEALSSFTIHHVSG